MYVHIFNIDEMTASQRGTIFTDIEDIWGLLA